MKHFILPDCQVKPGVPLNHLEWAGRFVVDKRPEVVVCLGDFADMPSLSSYDVGKKSFEGRRYKADIEAAQLGMETFLKPIKELNKELARKKVKQYYPRFILTLGNHENRINRCIESDPKLEGTISVSDLKYWENWEVYDFLDVAIVDGVCYSHYFTSGVLGRPVSSPNVLLTKKHQSCVMGHVQTDGIASQYRGDGTRITGIFAGSFYQHDEDYMNPQGNRNMWRGVWMLHEVENGSFDPLQISLNYLKRKYG